MLSRGNRSAALRNSMWRNLRGRAAAALAAVVIVATGTTIACAERVVDPVPSHDATTAKTGEALGPLNARTAGTYHNDFLDFAFPRILQAVSQGADQQKICKVIAHALRDYVGSRRVAVDPASIGDDIAGGKCAKAVRGSKPGAQLSMAGDGTPTPELDALVAEMSYAVESGSSQAELAALFDAKVTYARANFPEAEAEVVAAAAAVGLSSTEYWDANYATQEQALREAMTAAAYNRAEVNGPYTAVDRPRVPSAQIAPPDGRLNGSFWSTARKVAVSDLVGAVKGGIKGWTGGLHGIAIGAATEGGAASVGSLIGILLQ